MLALARLLCCACFDVLALICLLWCADVLRRLFVLLVSVSHHCYAVVCLVFLSFRHSALHELRKIGEWTNGWMHPITICTYLVWGISLTWWIQGILGRFVGIWRSLFLPSDRSTLRAPVRTDAQPRKEGGGKQEYTAKRGDTTLLRSIIQSRKVRMENRLKVRWDFCQN